MPMTLGRGASLVCRRRYNIVEEVDQQAAVARLNEVRATLVPFWSRCTGREVRSKLVAGARNVGFSRVPGPCSLQACRGTVFPHACPERRRFVPPPRVWCPGDGTLVPAPRRVFGRAVSRASCSRRTGCARPVDDGTARRGDGEHGGATGRSPARGGRRSLQRAHEAALGRAQRKHAASAHGRGGTDRVVLPARARDRPREGGAGNLRAHREHPDVAEGCSSRLRPWLGRGATPRARHEADGYQGVADHALRVDGSSSADTGLTVSSVAAADTVGAPRDDAVVVGRTGRQRPLARDPSSRGDGAHARTTIASGRREAPVTSRRPGLQLVAGGLHLPSTNRSFDSTFFLRRLQPALFTRTRPRGEP